MKLAWRATLEPITASAGTVILGVLCLLFSDLNSNRGLGPVAAIGIASSWLASMTFLPAVLALAGRASFWLGLALFLRADPRLPLVPPRVSAGVVGSGLVLVLVCAGFFHVGTGPALLVSVAVVIATLVIHGRRLLGQRWTKTPTSDSASS